MVAEDVTQRRYLEAIDTYDIVFGVGPAGTGKTYLAMAQAVSYLLAKRVTRIILARPAVEAGEKLGFLPGDLQEKVNPYLRPLYDALYDMLDAERVERLLERGVIEVAPIAFMRGRTLNDAFVILDEAQNTTSEQMKMFLTRLGFGSKAVVTGDVTQIDLPPGRMSGLIEALKVVAGIEGIAHDPLRRSRRRPPRARAADRQGLRDLHRADKPGHDGRAPARARRILVVTCPTRAAAAAAGRARLGAWLERAAPARRARTRHDRDVSDATMRRLNRHIAARTAPPTCCRSRQDVASRRRPRSRFARRSLGEGACVLRSLATSPLPAAWRPARPGRRASARDGIADSGAARPAAPPGLRSRGRPRERWRGSKSGFGAGQACRPA